MSPAVNPGPGFFGIGFPIIPESPRAIIAPKPVELLSDFAIPNVESLSPWDIEDFAKFAMDVNSLECLTILELQTENLRFSSVSLNIFRVFSAVYISKVLLSMPSTYPKNS